MTIAEMKELKKELGYTYAQISDLSGVPLGTVQKIFNGTTSSPRYETLQALSKIFTERTQPAPETRADYVCEPNSNYLREAQSDYMTKRQGEYTLEDYYKIPEDIRVELIDGVIYDMTAPASVHQLITGYIYSELLFHTKSHGGDCLPMVSPVDVQLDCDDKTMVEPDVIIVCDRDKVIRHCVYGAPDFVIEVLSPSTKKKDAFIKLNKYQNAGVQEYWMIDPKKKRVIVYDFAHDDYPVLYSFDDKVPVQIWEGECLIDFKEVYEHIRFLYERP
ncbi:MAG: Uma2 family endonuclease [Lachnospiraceae bacterium]|nr:Uma2 family endonuclease [Lachnospiraceae bacterium]